MTTYCRLRLTHHFEKGFQKDLVSGAVLLDLFAVPVYETVNHRILQKKIVPMTNDVALTDLKTTMLQNRLKIFRHPVSEEVSLDGLHK